MLKRILITALLLSTFLGMPSHQAFAFTQTADIKAQEQSYFPPPLCLPGMPDDGTCLFYGPAQTVLKINELGFPYPIPELPAAHPSASLGEMPVFIARINYPDDEPALIYGSFEDAVARTNSISQIPPGAMRYISYVNRLDHNGNAYLQLSSGGWLRASPAAHSDFRGLEFFKNPENDFGWIANETPTYSGPSYTTEKTGNVLYREELVQVYETVEGEKAIWYQVAPNEWVDSSKAKVVSLNPNSPEGVDSDRWIEVNLLQQTLSVYEGGELIFATLVSTGMEPIFTRPGLFNIYEKKPLETMQGAFMVDRSDFYYLQDVPWTMYFDEARALHAAYWRAYYGYPETHGCVNLSPTDAHWLYEWAEEGDFVWVHDPSGQTPTDPDYYGPGAP
ncbi:MAG: L,D-transpeptidase [Brevefilum sp.]|nr:L,D-transpeptidase [Brevefilum sp.]MDT8381749.1 L,D-transpeptidase [Brevefilum sp.]MDW7754066.1 L,D-transpeptidase [Brevefilum sp.]